MGLNGVMVSVGSTYIPKSYDEITAERNGTIDAWKAAMEAEREKFEGMTAKEFWNAAKEHRAANPQTSQTRPLTQEELSRLSGRYSPDMSKADLDALLVELLDLGAITEQDRYIALGMRPVHEMNTAIVMNNMDGISFDDLYGEKSDLMDALRMYEELLWRQILALQYEGRDYSGQMETRGSVARLMEVLKQLS